MSRGPAPTRRRLGAGLALALLLAMPAPGQAPADPGAAFAAAAGYDWGDSRESLRAIERAVADAIDGDGVTAALLEDRLIALLASPDATTAARSFACRQLALIGTGRSVPALAAQLGDPALSHPARSALEAMPAAEARVALAAAANALDGPLAAAMAHSAGRRDAWIAALAARGGPDDVPRLLDLAGADGAAARATLERMRDPGIDAALARVAEGENVARAALAVRLLGVRGAVGQRAVLDRLARDGDDAAHPSVRCAALLAIADLYDWRHDPDRARLLFDAMSVAPTAADRRAVLAVIDRRGDPAMLGLVQKHMRAGDTRREAARVAIGLALALEAADRRTARAALEEIVGDFVDDAEVRAAAAEAIAQVDRNESYLERWQVAGPYPKSDADAAGTALIDFAFGPERSEAAVAWQPVPADARRDPGIVDLGKFIGGNDRCAYATAVIECDRAQDARLEVGSDDGVKIWLNGEIVHRNDAMRGLTLRQDLVGVHLRAGRNVLLVKVTQGGGDWQFAVRVRGPDGLRLEGLLLADAP